jgi:hypothetical protein
MVRTTVKLTLALVALLPGGALALGQQASKGAPAKPAKPAPGSLEDLLSQALKNNPDIRLAEAKVREAEAELNRARMLVAQKIVALQHSIQVAEKTRDEAQARYDGALKLFQQGGKAVCAEDLRAAKLAWDRTKYELLKLQAEMPALLGKLPDGVKGEALKGLDALGGDAAALERYRAWLLLAHRASDEAALAKSPKGTMADKIRKALDKPIDANYKDKPLNEVLKEIEKHLEGIPLRGTNSSVPGTKMDLNLGRVSLGAAIQAFSDLVPDARFVVREYGILFTHKDLLPPDAVLLHDFWKRDTAKEKSKDVASEVKHPPKADIVALVKAVDDKSGLVTIDIGSDAGLAKGQTLEVYRLEPKAKYLGTIRIVEVGPKVAVGQPVGKLLDTLKAGDRLASQLK